MSKNKIKTQLEKYTEIVSELENWSPTENPSKFIIETFGDKIQTEDARNTALSFYSLLLEAVELDPTSKYHYFNGLIHNEEVNLNVGNLLLLAPLDSGKTFFIKEFGVYNDNTLTLVHYDKEQYNGEVMLYSEFVSKFNKGKEFLDKFDYILCEEFQVFANKRKAKKEMLNAKHYLLNKQAGKNILYFSSSESEKFKKYMESYNHIDIVDYHPMSVPIKRYFPEAEFKMKNLTDLYMFFEAAYEGFDYYGLSVIALSKTKYEQNKIFQIAKKENFQPINLSLVENTKERQFFLKTGEIPEGYNCIIIETLDENWNLGNEEFKLAIINSDSEIDHIRMFERLHENVEVVSDNLEEKY